MNKQELDEILKNHRKWLQGEDDGERANLSGADLSRADLYGANLSGANLSRADLSGANLSGANLSRADLYGANLYGANLSRANLSRAYLSGANLSGANLSRADLSRADLYGANLSGANLSGADLSGADLSRADLYGANLSGANLSGADLSGADLYGANLSRAENVPFIPYTCPDVGSFIGYKKARGYIVELEILSDAKRLSATGRKCRCDKAKVLSIQNVDGTVSNLEQIPSDYDKNFIYKVGEIVTVKNFDEDRWNECSTGIHFFINRQEAVEY